MSEDNEVPQPSESKPKPRRRHRERSDRVARLREEYLEVIRDGLGIENMSPAEERARVEGLEEHLADLFYLYAKVEMAKQLGILDWLRATYTGTFPDAFGGEDADDD